MTAAVYGEQFPLAATQAALGVGEGDCMQAVHDAASAQVRSLPSGPAGTGSTTRSPTPPCLSSPPAADRRLAASRLAEATLAEDPTELTEVTCRTAARLLTQAGHPVRASELYARTGKLALGKGAVEWAVADLTEAVRLQAPGRPPASEIVRELVRALFRAGQLARALELVDRLGPPDIRSGFTSRRDSFMLTSPGHVELAGVWSRLGGNWLRPGHWPPARAASCWTGIAT